MNGRLRDLYTTWRTAGLIADYRRPVGEHAATGRHVRAVPPRPARTRARHRWPTTWYGRPLP